MSYDKTHYLLNDMKLMQSTGFIDKDGEEILKDSILEDDIYKYSDKFKRFTIHVIDLSNEKYYCSGVS